MANRNTDLLFQLLKSLEKSEKRNFKLFVQRNSGNKDLKIISLFDAVDRMKDYDENALLKKIKNIEKTQLSNLKAHLYKEVLSSLRVMKSNEDVVLEISEQIDYARILYNKGLFQQSLRVLEKVKELAKANNQLAYLNEIVSFEKKIESLHITRSFTNRAEKLTEESRIVVKQNDLQSKLSNLALLLYSWYVEQGHARNAQEDEKIKAFFFSHLPEISFEPDGFYEELYLYQSYCWYAFIRQDFLMYYKYTHKWTELFTENSRMLSVETMHYIKGMHNLMNAHFDVRNHKKFAEALIRFEAFSESKDALHSDNTKVQTFVYLYSAKLNQHIISGNFEEALKLIPFVEDKINEYSMFIDRHRILVIRYKMAMVSFGAGDFGKSIDYLNKIINENSGFRTDLQCYARLLHLIAHYELGNIELVEYLTKSVYRFMAKMQLFTIVEAEIFRFLRSSFHSDRKELKKQFELLLNELKKHEGKRFEARTFAYLDIISWLESKIKSKTMADVIKEKFVQSKR